MDLAEMMKTFMAKEAGLNAAAVSSSVAASGVNPAMLAGTVASSTAAASSSQSSTTGTPFGTTYITEKLYSILQMYLQHKGWNSVELLQCFAEMKEAAMIPNAAAYLQMMASRVTLDSQGRLVHRENGKLILPFEHFANAVMLKHMNRPHSMHLNADATVRAVMEAYTIGREYFGMEKEFIYEVVQNCPECRYYKSQIPAYHALADTNDKSSSKGMKDLLPSSQRSHQDYKSSSRDAANILRASSGSSASFSKTTSGNEFSQNNMSLDLGNQSIGDMKTAMLELSRAKAAAAVAAAAATNIPSRSSTPAPTRAQLLNAAVAAQQQQLLAEKAVRNLQQEKQQQQLHLQQQQQLQLQQQQQQQQQLQQQQLQQQQLQQQQQLHQQQIQLQLQQLQQQQQQIQQQQQQQQKLLQQHKLLDQFPTMLDPKMTDFLRPHDYLDGLSNSTKELLALHNGAWSSHEDQSAYKRSTNVEGGQEKIVRAFSEVMRNLHRMKMCIRPSMCKPYGKQSEMLQKTLEDTLLLVQAMRSFLPPPQY